MEIGQTLQKYNFTFKKKWGQNFLTDQNLLRAIVSDAGVDKDTTVVEIGTGAGALTRAIAERAKRVVSFEIDRTLAPVLSETLAGVENAEVVFADFEKYDLNALEREIGEYVVVANLPYYVTTPIVMKLVEEGENCRGITVMVQEEVAARFAAREGTADYGAVTAAIALFGSCEVTRRVPRTMFVPRPNVDSAVVHIQRQARFQVDRKAYRAVVRAAFFNRRKTLVNNLIAAFGMPREQAESLLSELGIEKSARGETLSPDMFCRLTQKMIDSQILFRQGQNKIS